MLIYLLIDQLVDLPSSSDYIHRGRRSKPLFPLSPSCLRNMALSLIGIYLRLQRSDRWPLNLTVLRSELMDGSNDRISCEELVCLLEISLAWLSRFLFCSADLFKSLSWGWSTCFPSRGPKFSSYHFLSVAYSCLYSSFRGPNTSGLHGHLRSCAHAHMQINSYI